VFNDNRLSDPAPAEAMQAVSAPTYRAFGTFRLVLAMVVVLGHGAWLAPDHLPANAVMRIHAGSTAVLAFFVLSGFILAEAASTFYRGRAMALMKNRVIKIVPPFLGALAVSLAVHRVLAHFGLLSAGIGFEGYKQLPDMWSARNLLYNPVSVLPFLMPDRMTDYVGEIYLFVRYVWAINAEMMFYLFIGLFVLFRGSIGRTRLPTLAGTLALAVLYLYAAWHQKPWFYVTYAPFFVLGVSIHAVARHKGWQLPLVASAALSLVGAARLIGGGNVLRDPGLVTLPVLLGILVFAMFCGLVVVLSRATVPASLRRLDRSLGDLSYAVYLNHYVVLVLFSALVGESRGAALWMAALLAALVLSALMQLVIERPLAGLRARIRGAALA